jgi:hypothetical protein
MNILRRAISIFLIAAVMGGVVYIDQRQPEVSEGASSGIVSMAGFPHSIKSNRISSSWFCPGAAAGDGLDSASVFISNPSDTAITAAVSFLSNSPMESQTVEVPARNHSVVDVLRGRTVGVIVPVVEIIGSVGTVEQQLIYAAGDVTSQCVSQTSSSWYFADGFTAQGSSQRLVLTNPYPESAVVNVAYVTKEGKRSPTGLQGLILGPRTSRSLSLAEFGATDESSIALEVKATTGQIIASRMQHYLGGGRLGYSTTIGIPVALNEWWFAAGRTGPQVSERLVVFNPSASLAQVNVSFFGEGITNGTIIDENAAAAAPSATVDIPAGSVLLINTDELADLPKGEHAMVVSSIGKVPVVVEHVLSQITGGSSFTAITNGVPATLATQEWRIPSGLSNGARNALSLVNTTAQDGTYTVSAVGPGGVVDLPQLIDVPIGAAARISLDVPAGVNDGEVVIRSTVPLVVQRRTYRGHGLVGFGIVSALPVISK